jgi:hypothetical protein
VCSINCIISLGQSVGCYEDELALSCRVITSQELISCEIPNVNWIIQQAVRNHLSHIAIK